MDRADRRRVLEQQNVLLVDDDSTSVRAHRSRLEALGYHVVNATDSNVAMTIARQATPRVIFLSIDRSGSGRRTFLTALRSDDHTRHIPVAMLSNGHDSSMERLGLTRVGREHW